MGYRNRFMFMSFLLVVHVHGTFSVVEATLQASNAATASNRSPLGRSNDEPALPGIENGKPASPNSIAVDDANSSLVEAEFDNKGRVATVSSSSNASRPINPPSSFISSQATSINASTSQPSTVSTTSSTTTTNPPSSSSSFSTTDMPTPTSADSVDITHSSSSRTAVITSSVLASIFFLLFLGLLYYAIRRRSRNLPRTFRGELMSRNPGSFTTLLERQHPSSPNDSLRSQPVTEKPLPDIPSDDLTALPYSGVINPSRKQRKSRFPSMTTTTDLTSEYSFDTHRHSFAPLTDRQMELEQMIHDLQLELIKLNRLVENSRGSLTSLPGENDLRIVRLIGRIERLTALKTSDWALGRTDDTPLEFYQ